MAQLTALSSDQQGRSGVMNPPSVEQPYQAARPDIREYGPWGLAPGGFLSDNREGETLARALRELGNERGGTIVLPRADARVFTPPNLLGLAAVTLEGPGGADGFGGLGAVAGSNVAAARIIYAGLGERAFDFRSGAWWSGAKGIAFLADNPAFAGTIVDISGSQLCQLENCSFMGISTSGTLNAGVIGVSTLNCNSSAIRRCKFAQCGFGIAGRLEAGQFAISIALERCIFAANINAHVLNPHEAWAFDKCVFEGRITNKGITNPIANSVVANQLAQGVSYRDCWFGQTTANLGTHIQFLGNGLRVDGGTMSEAANLVLLEESGGVKPDGILFTPNIAANATVGLNGVAASGATRVTCTPLHQVAVTTEKA